MRFQKSQPVEAAHASASHCLVGPTENMAAPSPAKAHAHEMHEKCKSWQHFEHLRAIAGAGRYRIKQILQYSLCVCTSPGKNRDCRSPVHL